MIIYNVLWKDRHADTTVKPFRYLTTAIQCARDQAKSVCRSPEDYKETSVNGYLFHINYSCEGDCVWVVASEVDEKFEIGL